MLFFRGSRSQMFFKIGVLKNFAILEPFFNKVADLLLKNTYGGCFWIFVAANTFFSWSCRPSFAEQLWWLLPDFRGSKYIFQLSLVCIGDSSIGFCPGLLWKHELNLGSSHCSCSIKKVFLETVQIFQENTCIEVSFSKIWRITQICFVMRSVLEN